jgi:CSLREA domain-containing protein
MKNAGSPRTARKLNQRTRFITATAIFSLLLLLLGVPAYMQSLQEGESTETPPVEKANFKNQKVQLKSKADIEAAGQRVEQDVAVEPSAISATTNYTFTTATNASLTDMTGSVSPALVLADQDDTASAVTNIGFDFYFQGVRFTQFSVNSNGLMRLGSTAVQVSTPYKPLAQASIPLITPYGADQRTLASTGKVHFKVIGTAPNRTLVVEWLNMQANFNAGGTSDLTYQARLYETTGVIEYVYGKATMSTLGAADANSKDPHIGFSSSNTAGTVGSVTAPQSGTPAPTYNGASITPVANTYTAGTITTLNSATDGSRRIFTFTPPTPTAPTNLTFTSVTPSSYTLNWTDSANETLYAIYRSTDGTNYTFQNTAAQNATSFAATGLTPGTTYFWQVYAVSEGAFSSALSGSQASSAPGNITSTAVGGNWSATTTWVGGVVPTATDNVTIADAATVTVDTVATANAFSLSVGTGLAAPTTLIYNATVARTVTVATSVTIASNGIFQSAATGTITTHVLSVGTNLTNNGVLDFSTNANTAAASITFTGAANNTFGGTGATTDIRAITINKGTSNANVLELNPTNFTVRGASTDATNGYLTLTNGTYKISGTFTLSSRTFTASYTIAATAGIWLNNPNYTVSGINGSPINAGLLRLTQGIYTIGTASGNSMDGSAGAVFIIEGGTMNATGRFSPQSAVTYTQTAGTVNVCTVGQSSSNFGSFELFSTSSSFTMSGGSIVLHQASTATTPLDFDILGTVNYTGGTLQIGASDTATNFNFRINGNAPAIIINNTTNNKTATATAQTVVFGDTTVSPGTTLNLNGFLFAQLGANLVNNGTILGNTAGSRLYFAGSVPQTYSGSGVAGTTGLPLQSVDFDSTGGVTFNAGTTNNLITNRIIIFTGNITNANKLTLGVGGSSTGTVQIGNTTTPTNAGSFDVTPTFNLGTGGEVISYLRTTNARTTGAEINPSRTLTSMTYDDNDANHALTISGGDLTLSSTGAALTLTNGRVVTGSNMLALSSGTATVTRTAGYVDGNLRKTYASAVSKTFEVGTANAYSPVVANVTAGTFPTNFTARATQGKLPQISGTNALARYWTLTGTGITANLTFTYLASDVTGTVANYQFIKNSSGTLSTLAPTGTPTSTSAVINGVSSFSDWTLAEPGAVQPGTIEFSGVPVNINENLGPLSVSVFRTGGSDGAVSVQYATTDGTATAGNDYTAQTGTLNWASGDTSAKTITIPINDDSTYEDNETFTVNLSMPTGGATLGTAVKNATINDNDTAPGFSIDDVALAEGNSGTTAFVFTVTKTGATALASSVSYQTFDSSATTADGDYQATNGTLNFTATDTMKQITVLVNGDVKYEVNQVFNVKLSGATGALITDDVGDGTITNDDDLPVFTIDNVMQSEGNSGTTAFMFTVTKTGETDFSSSVQYTIVDGTATLGDSDYQSDTGTLNFAAADTTKPLTVLVNGDSTAESDETFDVQLFGATGATIGDNIGTGTIQNDDTANTNPTISDIPNQQTSQDNYVTAAFTVGDAETPAANLTLTGSSNDQMLVPDANITFGGLGANRTVTVTPAAGQTGTATITVTVHDASNATASDLFLVTVVPATCYAAPSGMAAWYSAENHANDIYGTYNGTPQGGATFAPGKVGQAFSLNGVDGYILVPDPGNGGLNIGHDLTIDAWINPTALGSQMQIVNKRSANGDDVYFNLYLQPDGHLAWADKDEIGFTVYETTASVQAGVYSHVAVTIQGFAITFYINGIAVNSFPYTTTHVINDGPLTIGITPINASLFYPFAGAIDEVELFSRTLTGTEINGIYNASSAGKCHTSTLALSTATVDVNEGDNSVISLAVTRTGAHDTPASVNYTTTDNTATGGASCGAGIDYKTSSGTLNFAAGETSKNVSVAFCDDLVFEGDETLDLSLSGETGTGVTLGSPATAVFTIHDDESAPTVSVNDFTFTGADSLTVNGFTVTLSNPSSSTVTVHYATSDNTATAGEDYTAASGTLTFAPGETSMNIPITILADNVYEPEETFFVDLDTPMGATLGDGHGVGTIPNDDAQPTISIDDVTFTGADSLVASGFTVTLSNQSSSTITVHYTTVDNTALAGEDYTATSGTLTFNPGETSKNIPVTILADSSNEPEETFFVDLDTPVGATLGDGHGIGTIPNDDPEPTLSIDNQNVSEGNMGPTIAAFTVTLSAASGQTVTVHYSTSDGTATTTDNDYNAASGDLTFTPGQTTRNVNVIVNGDTIYEPNETFTVTLSNPDHALITTATGNGVINNDDAPPATLVVNTTNDMNDGFCTTAHCSLREAIEAANSNADTTTINFNISPMDAGYNPTTQVWTITPATALPEITTPVIINGYSQPGATENTQAAGDDAVLKIELDGTTAASGGANGLKITGGNSTVKGLAINRFFNGIRLEVNGNNLITGNFLGTDAAGTTDLGNAFNGLFIQSDSNNNTIGGLTPAARNLISGNNEGMVVIGVTGTQIQGNFIGTDKTGALDLGNDSNGIRISFGPDNTIGGTLPGAGNLISKNHGRGVDINNASATGNRVLGNTIFANNGLGIDLNENGVTPNDAGDGDTGANNLQNFPVISSATVTGSTRTITGSLNSTGNTQFHIEVFSNTSCHAASPIDYGEGQTLIHSADVTTVGNDASFTFHPATLATGQFITATATDPAGNTSEFSQCVAVNNGTAGIIEFTSATYTAGEGDGMAHVSIKRTGGSQGSISAVFNTSNGTATAGSDYTAVTSYTVTFADEDTTSQTIDIPVTNDTTYEGNETVNLSLSGTTVNVIGGGQVNAVLTITENDAPPTLSVNDVTFTGTDSIIAGEATGFTVTLAGATDLPVMVHYATSDNTALAGEDYTATSGTLTFNPGETSKNIPVTILADSRNEPEETFFVDLDTPMNATLGDGHGIGTIPNDDPTPSISIGDVTKVEHDSGNSNVTFTVTLSNPSSQSVTLNYATADGTATAGPTGDYTSTGGPLTFGPGQITRTFTVPVKGDVFDEANESFSVVLSGAGGGDITDGTGICTIIDDDINTGDFDGDGKNDLSVFRPNADETHIPKWYILNSADGSYMDQQFGLETDLPVAGDYDGDGKKEIAVFRPSNGTWYISHGSAQNFAQVQWGLDGDKPVEGDYDGDGKTDIAVFRPTDGYWYIRNSDGTLNAQQWGISTDKPAPADYDGDGKTDLAVFRKDDPIAGSGMWYIRRSSDNGFSAVQWGVNDDKLVPDDYDLDGKADIAVWRPSDGIFYVLRSSDGSFTATQWGLSDDVPAVGDYDGDGKADITVWRPSEGVFYILHSSDGTFTNPIWGLEDDVPIAARYVPEQ